MNIIIAVLAIFLIVEVVLMLYRTFRVFLIKHVFDKWELFKKDDFNWAKYNLHYRKELSRDVEPINTVYLTPSNHSVKDGIILLAPTLRPLNENSRILYETILGLKPRSVIEIGCGGGDHLANLKVLMPDIELNGVDLLNAQLDFLRMRHPEIADTAKLSVIDITTNAPAAKAELAYTQAVTMHIQGKNRHINAIKNIFNAASKYVVLMENWSRHDYFRDLNVICKSRDFAWRTYNLYYKDSGKQTIIVISREPLKGYLPLRNNKELLKYI